MRHLRHFIFLFFFLFEPSNGQLLANLIGGNLNWTVNSNFGSQTNPTRTVSLTLTTLFTQYPSCTYNQGRTVDCSGLTINPQGCSGSGCTAAKTAYVHGTLCIAQLQYCSAKNAQMDRCSSYVTKYWPNQNAFHCLSDVNLGNQNVSLDKIGKTNAFTVQVSYDTTCLPGMTGDRTQYQISCGTSAVLGVLQHTVTVDDDVVALVAWLAPYGTASPTSLTTKGLLMPPCSSVTGGPCIVNLDQTGRMTDSSGANIGSEFDSNTASADNLYWRLWSKPTANAATDSMAWVDTTTGQAYPSCKVLVGCLALASPALETFIPLCANKLDYSDPMIQGSPGDGSYPPNTFCSNQPIKNYYSPVAQAPLAFSVPITPLTFNSKAAPTQPRHPYFNFQSLDLDGHQMQQRLPQQWSTLLGSSQNLGEWCLQWATQSDGSSRLVQIASNLCKSFFDLDRDPSRYLGNLVIFNVSKAEAQKALSATDPYAPLWTQSFQRADKAQPYSCTSSAGCTFSAAACTATSGCNDVSAQVTLNIRRECGKGLSFCRYVAIVRAGTPAPHLAALSRTDAAPCCLSCP